MLSYIEFRREEPDGPVRIVASGSVLKALSVRPEATNVMLARLEDL